MIEKALVALLTAADTLAGDRITPLTLEREPVLPAATYQRISTPRDVAHNGDQGYAEYRVQVNCWARRTEDNSGYALAKQLAGEVRQALNGFRGVAGGVDVGMCQVTNDRDDQDPERSFERVSVDITGNFKESKP